MKENRRKKIKLKPDSETKTNNKWKEQFDLEIEATLHYAKLF